MEQKLFENSPRKRAPTTLPKISSLNQKFFYETPKKYRNISSHPFKVLDACYLQDDFYINVLDWSKQNNITIGLNTIVYSWNFDTQKINQVHEVKTEGDQISNVGYDKLSENLIIGTNFGKVYLYDQKFNRQRRFKVSGERVGVSSLRGNQLLLGEKNGSVHFFDIRVKKVVREYTNHQQEVCGVEWSPCGNYFVSGGNENKMYVHSQKIHPPIFEFTHKAAVRALGWSKRKTGILASGAGTADQKLRVFDMNKLSLVNEVHTGSQICNLIFSQHKDEIYTSHGFSENEINVFNTNNLEKKSSLKAHTARVLFMAINPQENTLVTGAGDETLRFWDLNIQPQNKKSHIFSDIAPQMLR